MPKIVIILLYLVIVISSCNRQANIKETLAKADSVIDANPDSALKLLHDIEDAIETEEADTKAKYYLLQTEATYKLYQPTPPDSILGSIVEYYEKTRNNHMLCRAIYYRAMPLYEQGRHGKALSLLKTGEQMAIELKDTLYMAKYHESLCMVNYMADSNELMLSYAKLFLNEAIQLGDSLYISRAFSHVSTAYTRLAYHDSATVFIRKTLPYLKALSQTSRAYILTNIGCTYHKNGDLSAARHYLELSLTEHPMGNTYAEMGDLCADENRWDDAEKFWNKAIKTADSGIILNVLSSRFNRLKQQGKYTAALATMERIHHLNDSVHHASELTKIAEIQYKYDKQVVENRLYKVLVWGLVCALVVLLLVSVFIYYHRHTVRQYNGKLNESYRIIQETQQQIELLENSGEEHSREISSLRKTISDNRQAAYEQIGHGKEIHDSAMANHPIRYRDDEKCLAEYYSILHYNTFNKWMDDYRNPSSRLVTYLILHDMGKSDLEIESILSISSSSVRSIKSRLRARLPKSDT